jgi:hypothetical protein
MATFSRSDDLNKAEFPCVDLSGARFVESNPPSARSSVCTAQHSPPKGTSTDGVATVCRIRPAGRYYAPAKRST